MTKQLFPLSTILYCDSKCHANSDVGGLNHILKQKCNQILIQVVQLSYNYFIINYVMPLGS